MIFTSTAEFKEVKYKQHAHECQEGCVIFGGRVGWEEFF